MTGRVFTGQHWRPDLPKLRTIQLHAITDDDFDFPREMHRRLRAEAWQTP